MDSFVYFIVSKLSSRVGGLVVGGPVRLFGCALLRKVYRCFAFISLVRVRLCRWWRVGVYRCVVLGCRLCFRRCR